ncbi:MAG: VOC family protein [Bacteroidota bacterium]
MKSEKSSETPSVHFAYTILYVADVSRTLNFYQAVFGFAQKFLTPEQDYGELISGSTTLAFANLELGNTNFKEGFQVGTLREKPFGIELAFTTQDVKGLMEKSIAHGARELAAATTKPWGQEVGYVRDINGFILEICTPIGN